MVALYSSALLYGYMRHTRALVTLWQIQPTYQVMMKTGDQSGNGRTRQREDLSTEYWPYL